MNIPMNGWFILTMLGPKCLLLYLHFVSYADKKLELVLMYTHLEIDCLPLLDADLATITSGARSSRRYCRDHVLPYQVQIP